MHEDIKGFMPAMTMPYKVREAAFIYTRCPLPQFCPLMDRRFAEVQQLAKADPALQGRVRLIAVYDGSAWTAEQVVTDLRRALAK